MRATIPADFFRLWKAGIRGMTKNRSDLYGPDEAQRRFEAALRGARAAEPQPMKDIPPKRLARKKGNHTSERSDKNKR